MAGLGVDSCLGTAAKTPGPEAAPPTSSQCPGFANAGNCQLGLGRCCKKSQLPSRWTAVSGLGSMAVLLRSSIGNPTPRCPLTSAHQRGVRGGGSRNCPLRVHDLQVQ